MVQRPSGLHPHHSRDSATTTVSAGYACAMQQNVDGSLLRRRSLGFRGNGRAEINRGDGDEDGVCACERGEQDSIQKEVWKLLA